MTRKHIIGSVVIILIVGGAAFWGGMSYAKSSTPARSSFGAGGTFTRGAGAGFAGAGGAGGGLATGQVVSVGDGQFVLETPTSSSTEIVLVGDSTQILKTVSGSLSDLAPGTTVSVTGSSNSDGSLTAQSIQIRPAGTNFGGTAR